MHAMLQHRVELLAVPASCNETECWPVSNPEYTYSIIAGVWIAPCKTQTQIMFFGFNVRNCSKLIFSPQSSARDCSVAWPPLRVHPLSNVYFHVQDPSHIITANITYYNQTKTVYFNRQSALPEKVYLVCGDQAYSCFPRESHRRCYQAFLVSLIREVSKTEY